MKRWMNLGIDGQCDWPPSRMEVTFGDRSVVLMPRTREHSASLHLEAKSEDGLEEMTTANRLLSIISWVYRGSLQNDYGWSGNPEPTPVPKNHFTTSVNTFFLNRWNPLKEPKQQLAVALYREAMSVNSLPYQFLGFFKIINILHKRGDAQIAWIEATLPKLLAHSAIAERVHEISKTESNIARYLYETGRCAVAHAYEDPLVDPDDLTDLRRLSEDLGVARALAEYLIEHELHVPAYP